jgi:hypothetical protein
MKKVMRIIVCCILASQAIAQDRIHVGVKGGVTRTDIYYNENLEADPRWGFSGGAFASFPIGKFLGLQPEVIYTQRAFLAKGSINGGSFAFTRTTSNVDIPLYFQLRPVKFLTLVGGPQYSFLLDKTDRFRDGRLTDEQKQQILDSGTRNGTVGVAAGLDINIGVLVLSGRVGWDLQRNSIQSGNFAPQYNNRWVQGMMGIRF